LAVVAYTLIRTEQQRVNELIKKLKKFRFVKEVTPVYGEYNMIVKTETDSIDELNLFVYNELRRTTDIAMTTTMITAKISEK